MKCFPIFQCKCFALLLLLFVVTNTALATEWVWAPAASMFVARQEISTTSALGKIYVAGGIGSDRTIQSSVERFDPENDQWQLLKPLPKPRHHIALAAHGSEVYGLGGFRGNWPAWRAMDDVFVYDIEKNKWALKYKLPVARGEHTVSVLDNELIVIGGRVRKTENAESFFEHVDTGLTHSLNITTGQWKARVSMPTPRNSHAAAVIDGEVFVVGGRRNVMTSGGRLEIENLDVLEAYNPKTDTWRRLAPMPEAQGGLAAAAMNGKLYVFGGEQFSPDTKVFSSCWTYNPKSNTWQSLPDMRTPRHGLAAAAIGKKIFVVGGAIRAGFGAVAINEVLQLR